MTVIESFRERARATRAYLRSLADIEAKIIGRPGRGFYRASETVAASRAAAYIMMYNCVEHAVRESIVLLRRDVVASGCALTDLRKFWRDEIVVAKFGSKLKNGCNFEDLLSQIGDFLPGTVSWGAAESEIPFNGNIDHEKLIRFARSIGIARWKIPPGTLGGADLQAIKAARNDLAHGEEAFEDVGGACTTGELIERFERVRRFTISFLEQLDRYRVRQLFRAH